MTLNVIQTLCTTKEPGVYCARNGPERAVMIYNPKGDILLQRLFDERCKTYLKNCAKTNSVSGKTENVVA